MNKDNLQSTTYRQGKVFLMANLDLPEFGVKKGDRDMFITRIKQTEAVNTKSVKRVLSALPILADAFTVKSAVFSVPGGKASWDTTNERPIDNNRVSIQEVKAAPIKAASASIVVEQKVKQEKIQKVKDNE